jgi:hypothetical protein
MACTLAHHIHLTPLRWRPARAPRVTSIANGLYCDFLSRSLNPNARTTQLPARTLNCTHGNRCRNGAAFSGLCSRSAARRQEHAYPCSHWSNPFIGIWVVVAKDPVFVRSWSAKPEGWYSVFCAEARGAIGIADRDILVGGVPFRDKRFWTRLIACISTNTTRPARSNTRGTWEASNPALPLSNHSHSSQCENLDSHPGHVKAEIRSDSDRHVVIVLYLFVPHSIIEGCSARSNRTSRNSVGGAFHSIPAEAGFEAERACPAHGGMCALALGSVICARCRVSSSHITKSEA